MNEQHHKIARDYFLIAVVLFSYPFTWWRSRDRITATQAHELVVVRDARNVVRDQWHDAATGEICRFDATSDFCIRNWRDEIDQAGKPALAD